jgi:hypothetical protein
MREFRGKGISGLYYLLLSTEEGVKGENERKKSEKERREIYKRISRPSIYSGVASMDHGMAVADSWQWHAELLGSASTAGEGGWPNDRSKEKKRRDGARIRDDGTV